MPHIPRAVCATCKLEMHCEKQGEDLRMLTDDEREYYVINADRYQCSGCGQEAWVAFANRPIAEHFEGPKYDRAADGASHTVILR